MMKTFASLLLTLSLAAGTLCARAAPYRVGHWLPSDQRILHDWMNDLIQKVDAAEDEPLAPVIQEFQDLIDSDPELYMLFHQMFSQVPKSIRTATTPPAGRKSATTATCCS